MRKIFFLFASTILVWSCNKDDVIQESADNTIKISEQIASKVNDIIEESVLQDAMVNPDLVAQEIKKITGVKSTLVTPSGTTIFIEQEHGDPLNLLLVTMDDERMFTDVPKTSKSQNILETIKSVSKFITPNGKGKALILAPFQLSFQESLNYYKIWLEAAGYTVDIYMDGTATLDQFRGSFLDDYDIVYISTHGGDAYINSTYVNAIMTGEIVNDNRTKSLTDEQKGLISRYFSPSLGKPRYCISPAWIRETSDNKFPNTWVFINACYSAYDEVDESLSTVFFELGAVGFNGWKYSTSVLFSDVISPTMIKYFSQGYSFDKASDLVRDKSIANQLNIRIPFKTLDINNFLDFQNPDLIDPFYLIAPCVDNEGNTYRTVKISSQWWMAENLAYLPSVNPSSSGSSSSARYYVNGYQGTNIANAKATSNYQTYGVLYNWPAANNGCPTGWHLPSSTEFTTLATYLGGDNVAGGKLKEAGTLYWNSPNTGATNETGFTALPGGVRLKDGTFADIGITSHYWSSTLINSWPTYWGRDFIYTDSKFLPNDFNSDHGLSVRCIKN
jgi:uncharacterized protein (TIGR02145 family)